MAIFYFLAFLPILIGGVIWYFSKEVSWKEWLAGAGVAFFLAGTFHLIASNTQVADVQTYSGQIIAAYKQSRWKEYYEEAIYRTEVYYVTERQSYSVTIGSGKNARSQTRYRNVRVRKTRQVFDHWASRSRWHDEEYSMESNIGTSYSITAAKYSFLKDKFQEEKTVKGQRTTSKHNSRMIEGDPNDYKTTPVSGYIYPVTKLVSWDNNLKAGPSVFSFAEVPKNIPVFDWPENPDAFTSQRLLGEAKNAVSIEAWDKLNAYLGPYKKVNLIAIGFGDKDSEIAQYQRAKWLGGKKNDLVICYGGPAAKPTWVVVFGWTDAELVKENIQTLVLREGFSENVLPKIQNEVISNYKIKDWHAFDHLDSFEPSTKMVVWYIVVLLVIQGGLYVWFHRNEFRDKHQL